MFLVTCTVSVFGHVNVYPVYPMASLLYGDGFLAYGYLGAVSRAVVSTRCSGDVRRGRGRGREGYVRSET